MCSSDLARKGLESGARGQCPCPRCKFRTRQGKDDMIKHLFSRGYMLNFVTTVNFDEYERESGRVMRQRINGNEDDGIRNWLDDLRAGDMPDSPPSQEEPEEPPEPEEPREPEDPEPTAKAFFAMMASSQRPLYEGAKVSQLDAISQALAEKLKHGNTRDRKSVV